MSIGSQEQQEPQEPSGGRRMPWMLDASGFRSSGVHRFNSNNKIPEDVEVFFGELEAHLKT